MDSYISVPIPTSVFIELAEFLKANGSNRDPVQVIEDALHYWINEVGWKKEDLLPEAVSNLRGYSWKFKDLHVFLPHSTELRMRYKDKYYYARVEKDEILYNGQSVSPGNLVKLISGSNRNAWKDLWIRFPGIREWKLADECREDAEIFHKDLDDLIGEKIPPTPGAAS